MDSPIVAISMKQQSTATAALLDEVGFQIGFGIQGTLKSAVVSYSRIRMVEK
jgi:hypothetical protein